jgi:hypothetical protein
VTLRRAIEDVEHAEAELARQLRAVGERHAVESDLFHLGHALARKAADHVLRLAPSAERYGASIEPVGESPGLLASVRERGAELLGRSEAAGVLLLRDLRALYLAAQDAEIAWVVLVQGAKAVRDRELIELATGCHEETEISAKWVRTRIKESAPQVLAAR